MSVEEVLLKGGFSLHQEKISSGCPKTLPFDEFAKL